MPARRLSGFRIACGILWALIALICAAGGVAEVTISNAGGAIVSFIVAVGSAWYDVRVWTCKTRRLLLIIGYLIERPPATKPGG